METIGPENPLTRKYLPRSWSAGVPDVVTCSTWPGPLGFGAIAWSAVPISLAQGLSNTGPLRSKSPARPWPPWHGDGAAASPPSPASAADASPASAPVSAGEGSPPASPKLEQLVTTDVAKHVTSHAPTSSLPQ